MKKYISLLLIIAILCSLSGCNSKAPEPEKSPYDLEVTHEKFEDMPVVNASGSIIRYDNEQELFDSCDYVVVGMLTDTFTDGQIKKYGLYGQEVEEGSGEMVASVATLRDLTVLEVLKGELPEETLTYADMAISSKDTDGTEIILWLPDDEFIQKQNVKYIFYLKESSRKDGIYYSAADQGVINIDGLDVNGSRGKYISEERYDEVRARFSQYFEKYDRSEEKGE